MNANQFFLYKDIRIYYFLVLLFFLLIFNYDQYWYLFSPFIKFESWSVYGDLRLLLKGIDLYGIGKNPFNEQYNPPYNYPSTWKFFSYLSFFNSSNYRVIGFFLIVFAQLLFLMASGIWDNYRKAIYFILLLISPVSVLIFERGNNDLILFSLLIFPIVVFKNNKIFYVISFLLAFVMKIYPLGAGLLLLYFYQFNVKNRMLWATVIGIIFLYIGMNFDEILLIRDRTPTSIDELSFGFTVPLKNIISHNPKMHYLEYVYWIGYFALFLIGLSFLFKKSKNKIDILVFEDYKKTCVFLVGAGIFLFSFFLSISWEYRLFFLLLCTPAILIWYKANLFGAKFLAIAIPLIFWNQTLRNICEKIFHGKSNGIFIFNQLLISIVAAILIVYIYNILKGSISLKK